MSGWIIVPPSDNKCPICAVDHDVDYPHDATTFYYRFLFKNQHGRDATWSDAMLHCPEEIRERWSKGLTDIGIDVNSTQVLGDIKTQEELEARMKKGLK
jgi:hypothetical protein